MDENRVEVEGTACRCVAADRVQWALVRTGTLSVRPRRDEHGAPELAPQDAEIVASVRVVFELRD